MSRHHSPAVYAGLVGALVLATPQDAQALTVFGQQLPGSDPAVAFVAGCAVGAVVATGVTLLASHASVRRRARLEASSMAQAFAPASQVATEETQEKAPEVASSAAPQAPAAAPAAAAPEPQLAPESHAAPEPAFARPAFVPSSDDEDLEAFAVAYARSRRAGASVAPVADVPAPVANEPVVAEVEPDAILAASSAGSHAEDLDELDPSQPFEPLRRQVRTSLVGLPSLDEPSARQAAPETPINIPAGQRPDVTLGGAARQLADSLPEVPTGTTGRMPKAHPSDELEQAAQRYADERVERLRKQTRARGVASVLSERLGRNRMEGLPVISRADGTVADIGTSWWDSAIDSDERYRTTSFERIADIEAVDESIDANDTAMWTAQTPEQMARLVREQREAQAAGTAAQPAQSSAPAAAGESAIVAASQPQAAPAVASETPVHAVAPHVSARRPGESRAAYLSRVIPPVVDRNKISSRVANPAEVYPVMEYASASSHDDGWQSSLDAMEERYHDQRASASLDSALGDIAGGSTEPSDGLGSSAATLPIDVMASRSGAFDTDAHLDKIIREEIEAIRPDRRRRVRSSLKVIDGGADDTLRLRGRARA